MFYSCQVPQVGDLPLGKASFAWSTRSLRRLAPVIVAPEVSVLLVRGAVGSVLSDKICWIGVSIDGFGCVSMLLGVHVLFARDATLGIVDTLRGRLD
jgi:hypothetical protein